MIATDLPSQHDDLRDPEEFASIDELNEHLLDNPLSVQAAVLWNVTNDGADGRAFNYQIQANFTGYRVGRRAEGFVKHILLPVQQAVDREVMRFTSDDAALEYGFDLHEFAHPPIVNVDVWGSDGWEFVMGVAVFVLVSQTGLIVAEKELKLRSSLEVAGLKRSAYWASWMVVNTAVAAIEATLLWGAGWVFGAPYFRVNSPLIVLVLFVSFFVSVVPLAMVVSSFTAKSSVAATVGFLIYIPAFALGIMVFAGLVFKTPDEYEDSFAGNRALDYVVRCIRWTVFTDASFLLYEGSEVGNEPVTWANRNGDGIGAEDAVKTMGWHLRQLWYRRLSSSTA